MMLFVDAVEYTEPISGDAKFAEQFASRAVRDSQGRSLRDFDLTRRLFRYPLSYVIYSPAFDALPSDVKSMFYAALERGADGRRHERELRALERRRPRRDSRDSPRHETRRRGRRSQLKSCVARPFEARDRGTSMSTDSTASPSRLALATAFAIVYVIWGSTFLAILFAIETLPPFLMAGARFLVAGSLLYAWSRLVNGAAAPSRAQWRATAVVGVLLLLGGNGLLVWSEQRIPSGVAALLVGTVPCFMVLLDWLRPGGVAADGARRRGFVAGLAGARLARRPRHADGRRPRRSRRRRGRRARVVLVGRSARSTRATRRRRASPFLSTAMQMLGGRRGAAACSASCSASRGRSMRAPCRCAPCSGFSISSCSARSSRSAPTSGCCASARRRASARMPTSIPSSPCCSAGRSPAKR